MSHEFQTYFLKYEILYETTSLYLGILIKYDTQEGPGDSTFAWHNGHLAYFIFCEEVFCMTEGVVSSKNVRDKLYERSLDKSLLLPYRFSYGKIARKVQYV